MICVGKQVDWDGPFQNKRFARRSTGWTMTKIDEIIHGWTVSLARNVDEVTDTFVFPQQTNDVPI